MKKTSITSIIAALILCVAIALIGCDSTGNSSFDITGSWKSVGEEGPGQAQPGAIVAFNGQNCNLYSPQDTYGFYKDGDQYRLDVTGLLGGNLSYTVKVIDNSTIELYNGDELKAKLQRVS
jgi:hypothetical protein